MDTYEHLMDEFILLKYHSQNTDKELEKAKRKIEELERLFQKENLDEGRSGI